MTREHIKVLAVLLPKAQAKYIKWHLEPKAKWRRPIQETITF